MGATLKRREIETVCRSIGDLNLRGVGSQFIRDGVAVSGDVVAAEHSCGFLSAACIGFEEGLSK